MKTLIVLAGVLFLTVSVAKAQIIVDPKTSKPSTPSNKSASTKSTSTRSNAKKSKFDVDRSVNKANNSVNNANNTVNNASSTASNATDLLSSTADKAKELVHKVGALIPSKKGAGGSSVNTTVVSVQGLNFTMLKKLNENVQACSKVQDTKLKFSRSVSTITVTHTGSSADLLKRLERKSKDIFTDDNVSDFNEGSISIKVK